MHFFHYVVFFLATILLTRVHALYLPFVGKQDSVNNPYPAAIDNLQQSPVSHPARVEKVLYGGEDEEEDEDDEYEQQDIAPKTPKKSKDQSSQQRVVEYKDGLTVAVETDNNFCLMLPLSPGNRDDNGGEDDPSAIADSEKSARAFCTNENVNVPGASTLPPGFITSAHFAQDLQKGFVQVRGSIDRDAYSLSSSDSGGQYDDHGSGAPPGSHCKGYPYYVSLIEPNLNRFCIRCCQEYEDCNAGRSEYGCDRIVPEID
ncbi:hypothetical protein VTP01DRAFT_139 [Rhizomucor pusillus]|uniref:uncharacterized protein n=1 Tax=Rhizomucor pusillus TaxID=4840 RepID=UPI00374251BF